MKEITPQPESQPNWVLTPDSSQIEAIAYDEPEKLLYIKFKSNGAVYCYFEVPFVVWECLLKAESKGRYFAAAIKGVFRYQKLS